MLLVLVAVSVLLPLGCFIVSMWRVKISQAVVCHFWYFTLIWMIAFPLRAVLIGYDFVEVNPLIPVERDPDVLGAALAVSLLLWGLAYLGFVSVSPRISVAARSGGHQPAVWRSIVILALTVGLAMLFLSRTVMVGGEYRAFEGSEQLEARVGAGAFFLMAELFSFAAVVYVVRALVDSPYGVRSSRWILYGIVFALALLMTVAINSRRVLGIVLFVMAVEYSLRKPHRWAVCWLGVVGSIALAPVFQMVRYLDVRLLLNGTVAVSELFDPVTARSFLTALSSTFEGVDHLVEFLRRASLPQLIVGVDGGVAWLINAGLALVPRAIWPAKPLVTGSVAEQLFLYPEMFVEGPAVTTLPPSFVVDFAFGCGIPVGLLLAFLLGRVLAVLWQDLWNRDAPLPARAVSLFVFVNVFNIVRGGTGVLQIILLFGVIVAGSLGVRETGGVLASTARRVMGRGWAPTAARPV